MQICMKFEREASFNVVLRLQVHLLHASVSIHGAIKERNTYVNQLVNIFDINSVSSDTTDEIHETQLRGN